MKKALLGVMFLSLAVSVPIPAMAGVSVHISIPLPPPIVVAGPPEVVLLPHTGVYVAPDLAVDLFFFDGWWWRSWEGRWYRSRHYHNGWAHYNAVPAFHGRVPPRWRDDYRAHRWHGQEWRYERVSHRQLQQIHQRNYREQSRPQYRTGPPSSGPQRVQADRPSSQGRTQQRDGGRFQQPRPQQEHRPGPKQSRPPHGKPEGRK
jgi:hypothetical protein